MKNQRKCSTNPKILRDFLNLCDGNWHNSVYLSCNACRESSPDSCESRDFLFLPDGNGIPLLLTLTDAEFIFPIHPEKEECLFHLDMYQFTKMYAEYFLSMDKKDACPCRLLLKNAPDKYHDW